MSHPAVARRSLQIGAALFLIWLAWQALAGGLRQARRARTPGQKVETVVQIECGLLSLLVALTSFWRPRWAGPARVLWSVSLAGAAGLSGLVWGPAMPGVAALFAGLALLVARGVIWILHEGDRQ